MVIFFKSLFTCPFMLSVVRLPTQIPPPWKYRARLVFLGRYCLHGHLTGLHFTGTSFPAPGPRLLLLGGSWLWTDALGVTRVSPWQGGVWNGRPWGWDNILHPSEIALISNGALSTLSFPLGLRSALRHLRRWQTLQGTLVCIHKGLLWPEPSEPFPSCLSTATGLLSSQPPSCPSP